MRAEPEDLPQDPGCVASVVRKQRYRLHEDAHVPIVDIAGDLRGRSQIVESHDVVEKVPAVDLHVGGLSDDHVYGEKIDRRTEAEQNLREILQAEGFLEGDMQLVH